MSTIGYFKTSKFLQKKWRSIKVTIAKTDYIPYESVAQLSIKFDFSSRLTICITPDYKTFYAEHLDTSEYEDRVKVFTISQLVHSTKECMPSVKSRVLDVSTQLEKLFTSTSNTTFKLKHESKENVIYYMFHL